MDKCNDRKLSRYNHKQETVDCRTIDFCEKNSEIGKIYDNVDSQSLWVSNHLFSSASLPGSCFTFGANIDGVLSTSSGTAAIISFHGTPIFAIIALLNILEICLLFRLLWKLRDSLRATSSATFFRLFRNCTNASSSFLANRCLLLRPRHSPNSARAKTSNICSH